MNLTEIAKKRYSTKEFDPDRKIPEEVFNQIKDLLRLSPSSVNIQPWHFVIADTMEGKKRLSKGTQGDFIFNEAKVVDASHVILFCVKTDIDEEYKNRVLEKEEEDGRFADAELKEMVKGARTKFVNIHLLDLKDADHWMEKQVYLNMGTVLLGAAALGVDALPMEGIDMEILDKEFGLKEKGYRSMGIVSLGYHRDTDFNATLPKSRLGEDEIFTILK